MSLKVQRALISVLVIAGTLIVGFFGIRAIFAFREFRRHGPPPFSEALEDQPMETDVELIRDWMTVPYIAMTYRVHPKSIFDALGINPKGNDEKSLTQLNEQFFPDKPGMVIELVKAAVSANQAVQTDTMPDTTVTP